MRENKRIGSRDKSKINLEPGGNAFPKKRGKKENLGGDRILQMWGRD